MSSFKDTSIWKKKDASTLVYSYEVDGKQHDGSSEKEPNSLLVQLERMSALDETSWRLKDDKEPESETGYSTREFITATGVLDGCRVHAITLDESENEVFSQLDISIYPVELERLKATSTVEEWSSFRDDEKPEDGWLKDEIGRIAYYGMDEYFGRSSLSARLFLSQEKFDDLVRAIKEDTIRSARLQVFADVFQFGYESMGAGISGHYYNYAILCEDDGKRARGHAQARLQEVLLEWSPKLEAKTAGRRDEPDEDDYFEPDMPVERVAARLARDVLAIRSRIDLFYQAAIFVVVFLVLQQVIDWLGL
jgi:hypothetical protein